MLIKKNPTDLPAVEVSKIKKTTKTSVVIKYDVGFGNALYLRGRGANLSWDKGIMLRNISADEWVWETDASFTNCEFKAVINDTEYEIGENHLIKSGQIIQYTPEFNCCF
jgi:hypothetical protein